MFRCWIYYYFLSKRSLDYIYVPPVIVLTPSGILFAFHWDTFFRLNGCIDGSEFLPRSYFCRYFGGGSFYLIFSVSCTLPPVNGSQPSSWYDTLVLKGVRVRLTCKLYFSPTHLTFGIRIWARILTWCARYTPPKIPRVHVKMF